MGNESHEHRVGTALLGQLCTSRRFKWLSEECHSDVVAWRIGADNRLWLLCLEHDIRIRTVLPNIGRNFARGADVIVILVPDNLQPVVRRLLRRHQIRRVGIITRSNLERVLQKAQP